MSLVQLSYLVQQFFALAWSKLDVLDVLTTRALLRCVVITEVRLDSIGAEQGERQERAWQPRHRQTEMWQTDRQTHRATGRQADSWTEIHTERRRQTEMQTGDTIKEFLTTYHSLCYIHNVPLVAAFALLRLHAAAAATVCSRCSWYEPHSLISSPLLHWLNHLSTLLVTAS